MINLSLGGEDSFLVNIFNPLQSSDYRAFSAFDFNNLKMFPQLTFYEGKVRAVASSGFTGK